MREGAGDVDPQTGAPLPWFVRWWPWVPRRWWLNERQNAADWQRIAANYRWKLDDHGKGWCNR